MVGSPLKRNGLRALPADSIVQIISETARAWTDRALPARAGILPAIAARTGYSLPVVDYALDQLFAPLTRDALRTKIVAELGALEVLDGFVSTEGRPDAHAGPIGSVCIVASRTTIGVALVPAIYALCAKCDVTVKDREDHLIGAFFQTLSRRHEAFSHAARTQAFSSKDEGALDLRQFGCVVAFGKDQTLVRIRSACAPDARFIGFGSRAGAGYISKETLREPEELSRTLEGAARDLVLYDSEGCMSLHVLFVENPRTAQAVARNLSSAARDAARQFPIGERDASAALRVAGIEAAAAFRQALRHGALFADEGHTYAILFGRSLDEPPPFAPRCISVLPVHEPGDALHYLRKHGIALEAFALSDSRDDIVQMAIAAGAVRVARFGELQKPLAAGNHGGRGRIVDFIRWIDRET